MAVLVSKRPNQAVSSVYKEEQKKASRAELIAPYLITVKSYMYMAASHLDKKQPKNSNHPARLITH
jgi:hypothetical protein